jgi:hypothetical protein
VRALVHCVVCCFGADVIHSSWLVLVRVLQRDRLNAAANLIDSAAVERGFAYSYRRSATVTFTAWMDATSGTAVNYRFCFFDGNVIML